jgi:2,4-dienoyl-CoA reductase-like NADH-dependent reductase (Old Yellow Enzyme family)
MKKIFTPIKIGNLELKNRMIVSAMVSNYCKHDGIATEQYTAYHERKAKGGWGLVITENYTIVPDGGGFVDIPGLWEDSQIPSLELLTTKVARFLLHRVTALIINVLHTLHKRNFPSSLR